MVTAAARTPTKPLAPAAAKTPTKPMGPAAAAKTPTKPLGPVAAAKTPTKAAGGCSSSRARFSRASENSHPNIPGSPPPQSTPPKSAKSPAATGARSASAKKKPSTPAPAAPPPPPRGLERRFLVAKKGARRRRNVGSVGGGGGGEFDKCREAAREALRASQEEFFRKERAASTAAEEKSHQEEGKEEKAAEKDGKAGAFEEGQEGSEAELEGSSKVRALRTKAMAKAMSSVPDPGAGRVKHLVQAFESLLTIAGATSDADRAGEGSWVLPGLQPWKEEGECDLGLPPVSVFSSADFLNAGPNRLCSSLDGNNDRLSWGSRRSDGGRKSRRNTSESLRNSWNKKLKVTSQHPFKLRTEQRGRAKEQQFVHKVQEMLMEEEKKRIHIAQGLPWTTDEPECLIKPLIKERTEPIDLVLHSDVRSVERAEFDQYVSERNKFAEQLRLERERQQELEDQERIRQLRKELVPKAQPMPYFDRPFIPKRSTKPATVPMEPKFHPRPEKQSCGSAWSLES
ncbi:microtubule-destabilizing protein 60-like isoform X2 [Phragmites australis]|uniref:microtubule-destabilizing protein 60-like isoform X2 n=1 Tax=Phragmites australis TaxID=29695 RepID=UPI002D78E6A6|nr:microtubule-destabilizing protein 60-like isoform X2 [Phragmites australis]